MSRQEHYDEYPDEMSDGNNNVEDEESMDVGQESSPEKDSYSSLSTPEKTRSGRSSTGGNSSAFSSGGSRQSSSGSRNGKRRSRQTYSESPLKMSCDRNSRAHYKDDQSTGFGRRHSVSPSTRNLNQSQMHLSAVSLSSPRDDDYVNLSQVLPQQQPTQHGFSDRTAATPQRASATTQRALVTPQRALGAPHRPSAAAVNLSTSKRVSRPQTLKINDCEYVSLEDFQKALNPATVPDEDELSEESSERRYPERHAIRNLAAAFSDDSRMFLEDEDEETITVLGCLQKRNQESVDVTCVCYIIELEPAQPLHPLVVKPRRKICLGDSTGVMVGYIKRSQPIHFEKGQTLRLHGFSMKNQQFTIHSNTAASTAYDIQIPDEMKALGLEEYNKPQTPFMTVDCLKRSPNGTIGSVKGTVITTEHARSVGQGQQSLVKTISIKDNTGTMTCSLWGSAANSGEIELGQRIILSDVKSTFHNKSNEKRLNINNADQIILKPPENIDEVIKVMGIEETDKYSIIILSVIQSHKNERLTIDRQIMCDLFNGGAPITVRQILSYLPFRAQVHITGQKITSMDNVRVSSRVAHRLRERASSHAPGGACRLDFSTSGDTNRTKLSSTQVFVSELANIPQSRQCSPSRTSSSGRHSSASGTASTEPVPSYRDSSACGRDSSACGRYSSAYSRDSSACGKDSSTSTRKNSACTKGASLCYNDSSACIDDGSSSYKDGSAKGKNVVSGTATIRRAKSSTRKVCGASAAAESTTKTAPLESPDKTARAEESPHKAAAAGTRSKTATPVKHHSDSAEDIKTVDPENNERGQDLAMSQAEPEIEDDMDDIPQSQAFGLKRLFQEKTDEDLTLSEEDILLSKSQDEADTE